MHPLRKQRLQLVVGGFILSCIGFAIILYALRDNLNVFYTPTEIQLGKAANARVIRVGGIVAQGSLTRGKDVAVRFDITDTHTSITVDYHGILPDLFREGKGIVAIGKLSNDGILKATQVLAKHDENYMPPEAMEAIQRNAKKTMRKQ